MVSSADARRETRRRDDGRRKNKPFRLVRSFVRSFVASSSAFVVVGFRSTDRPVASRRVGSRRARRRRETRDATRDARERETTDDGKRGKK